MAKRKVALAKELRPGEMVKLPPIKGIVRDVVNMDIVTPTFNGNIKLIKITHTTGPFKGQLSDYAAWEDDKIDVIPSKRWYTRASVAAWKKLKSWCCPTIKVK